MKKLTPLIIITIFVLISGCKKTKLQPSETPFSSILADSTYKIVVTTKNNSTFYEYGLKFTSSKAGKINKLGCWLPNSGQYRMCLWDFENKNILAQTTVNQSSTNKFSWAEIPSINIEPNKQYFVSIISNNWHDATNKLAYQIPYPLEKNNIKILTFAYIGQANSSASPKLPNMEDNRTSISGFVDFSFIPN